MSDDDEQRLEASLAGTADAISTITEGMGTLVAARKTLIDGGFSSDEAYAIVLTALQAASR